MPTLSISRAARIRRALTISAAAVAVVLSPTACDSASGSPARDEVPSTDDGYGYGSGYGHGSGDGHHGGGHGAASDPVVVPVGNITERDDEPHGEKDEEPEERAEKDEESEERAEKSEEEKPASGDKLDILGNDCSTSRHEPHDGFQKAPRCVSTAFGEVAQADHSPSLLITSAPHQVASGKEFPITVSTRNLVRDRFLAAAAGGYYAESSFLDPEGIQRGHFHTACRMLPSTDVAPDAAPEPAFFLATQDNAGGAGTDSVTITVTGLEGPGTAQCAVWAGDGSHRVPMMERANQTPAFDAVRITVK